MSQVTGDRRPEEVYRDFKHVFYNIVADIQEKKEQEEAEKQVELGDKPVIWVVGGPGSRKYDRVVTAMKQQENWSVISTGNYPSHSQFVIIWNLGKMFRDYLSKINAATEETEDDNTNNNIVNENKQITKTLTDMLQQGSLVPHVMSTITFSNLTEICLDCCYWHAEGGIEEKYCKWWVCYRRIPSKH